MKKTIILASALIATAAPAQPTARSINEAVEGADPTEIVCVRLTTTGSRLAGSRRCLTRAEWAEHQRSARTIIDEAQIRQVNPMDMNPGVRADANGRYLPAGRGGAPR